MKEKKKEWYNFELKNKVEHGKQLFCVAGDWQPRNFIYKQDKQNLVNEKSTRYKLK